MLNDQVFEWIETLSRAQQRSLQILMYLQELGKHVLNLANFQVDLLHDNVAQRLGVHQLSLPFRIQFVRSLRKHRKLRELSKPFLRPEQYETYEQFLAELEQQKPFPLMVAVRYSYPKVNKFIATLQDVDYSLPNTAALNAANFRAQLAFSYLNAQKCVLYTAEQKLDSQGTVADFAFFIFRKLLGDFGPDLLEQLFALDKGEQLDWLKYLHQLHGLDRESRDSEFRLSQEPAEDEYEVLLAKY